MSEGRPGFRCVGKAMPVIEDRRFVRGRGRYINDLELPGMLHIGLVSAPMAHARIVAVDPTKAERAGGVVAVLTGRQIAELMTPIPQELDIPNVVWYPLAVEKVRFAGEWVAAIVASSRAAAEDAAELVDVTYEELVPVVDPEMAMAPGAPMLHEGHGSNVVWHEIFEYGDVEGAFADAEHVSEHRLRWHRHSGVPLETFGCVAARQPSGILDVWASHQNPGIQQEMMEVLRLPAVRVNMDIDVGGSYGAKRGRKQMYLTAIAALITGRPVKLIEDRVENMQAGDGHGPDRLYTVKAACSKQGVVKAIDVQFVDDLGAYCGRGPRQMTKPLVAVVGPYHIKSVRYGGYGVLTCKTNQSPCRGAGQPPHNFVLERTMDRLAAELDIDRMEIRRRNYIGKDEFPYQIPTGAVYDSGDYASAADLAIARADLSGLRKEQARARGSGRLVGIGIAGALDPSGAYSEPESARLQVDEHGRVVATIGFQSAGQSHESMVTQMLCEELGVAAADVTVQRGNGMDGIVGGATTGNRMTLMLGGAVHAAAERVRGKLSAIAATALGVGPEAITVDGRRYQLAGDPSRGMDLTELAQIAYRRRDALPAGMEPGVVESATYAGPGVPGVSGPPIGRGGGFASYSFEFHIATVEVDPDTYDVRFLDYVIVHDCGTVINPLVVDGFVYGGVAHGVGAGLYEQYAYDELGFLRSANLMDYLIPTACEMPRVRLYSMETPSPWHPYGAKGAAEGAYLTTPALIASAVEDALAPLGIVMDELPITPSLIHGRMRRAELLSHTQEVDLPPSVVGAARQTYAPTERGAGVSQDR